MSDINTDEADKENKYRFEGVINRVKFLQHVQSLTDDSKAYNTLQDAIDKLLSSIYVYKVGINDDQWGWCTSEDDRGNQTYHLTREDALLDYAYYDLDISVYKNYQETGEFDRSGVDYPHNIFHQARFVDNFDNFDDIDFDDDEQVSALKTHIESEVLDAVDVDKVSIEECDIDDIIPSTSVKFGETELYIDSYEDGEEIELESAVDKTLLIENKSVKKAIIDILSSKIPGFRNAIADEVLKRPDKHVAERAKEAKAAKAAKAIDKPLDMQ